MRGALPRGGDAILRGAEHLHMADRADRRAVARAHARRAHDAHTRPELAWKIAQQRSAPAWRRTASRTRAP